MMDSQYLRAPGAGESMALGDLTLPGIITSIEVRGQYEIVKKKVVGLSGSDKFGYGYNDAQVTITLEILPPDAMGQVKQIEGVFKNAFGAAGKSKPLRVINPLLDSKDVTNVLFVTFKVFEGNEDDSLLCTLELLEFEPLARIQGRKQRVTVGTGPRALPTGKPAGAPGSTQGAAPVNSVVANFEAGLTNSVRRLTPGAPPLLRRPTFPI